MNINCLIKGGKLNPHDFAGVLSKFALVIDIMAKQAPILSREHWRMTGDTLENAQHHPAYNSDGTPNADALEMLDQEFRRQSITSVSIWDGSSDTDLGSSIECYLSGGALSDSVIVSYDGEEIVTKEITTGILAQLACSLAPTVIEVSPIGYSDKKAFPDKPGAGWMLYLPRILKTKDVPEAGELIPVEDSQGKSVGTIIVSIADAVFSVDNPAHLEIAHNIEARLISNGWLPRFTDI